jgi:hypothetical protein
MKSGELVKILQELDPTGKVEVTGTGGDIYFLDYEDGFPFILVHNEALKGKCYSIIGGKFDSPPLGHIYMHQMNMDDVLLDNIDAPITSYGGYHDDAIAKARKEAKQIHNYVKRHSYLSKIPVIKSLYFYLHKFITWPLAHLLKRMSDALHQI